MVIVDRTYGGAAVAATLQTAMTALTPAAGGTITVSDDSGYPVTGKFEIVVDRGATNEESILINSRSGTTFTIGQRGYDGTTAGSHTINVALVELDLSARTVQLFVDHVDDVEADPHSTKLLNNTRHDVEARHQFGAALGSPVTPTALTPDIAGAVGTGNNPAKEDHVHSVPAAAAVTSGLANAEGAAATFARSDHTHDQAALSINTAELVDLAVTGPKLAADAVDNTKITDNAINTAEILNGAITLVKFASEAGSTWALSFPGVSLGTGGVQYGQYLKFGRLVVGFCGFQLGTASANVASTISFNFPVNSDNISGFTGSDAGTGGIIAARAYDSGTNNRWSALGISSATGATNFVSAGVGSVWDATVPWNWSNNDKAQFFFAYLAAA